MNLQNVSDLSLDSTEYCFLVGSQSFTNTSFKVHVPKLMPLIQSNSPQTKNIIFNPSIFVNDNGCKPAIGKSITTQNYMTIKKDPNAVLYHLQQDGMIPSGTRLKCITHNHNMQEMTVTTG